MRGARIAGTLAAVLLVVTPVRAQDDEGWKLEGLRITYDMRLQKPPVRLAEVVDAFPAHRLNIEIKQGAPAIVDATLAVLRAGKALDRTLLAAEHDDIMQAIRKHGYSTLDQVRSVVLEPDGTLSVVAS